MTIGDMKARLRGLEEKLYVAGRLVSEKRTPQRELILRQTAERYDALAQRVYRLGIGVGEW